MKNNINLNRKLNAGIAVYIYPVPLMDIKNGIEVEMKNYKTKKIFTNIELGKTIYPLEEDVKIENIVKIKLA